MNRNEHQEKGKGNDVDASDDTLGENTEQTSLAKEVKKEKEDKQEKKTPKQ